MSAAALGPSAWRPPGTERYGIGATLALLAHAALVAALAFGLRWRIQSPPVFSAELWAAVPQSAAPAATPPPAPAPAPSPAPAPAPAPPKPAPAPPRREAAPPPPPRAADIAAERARAEQRRAQEAEARRRAEEQARHEAEQKEKARRAAEEKARAEKAAADKRQREQKEAKQAEDEARQIAKAREANLKRMLAQAGNAESAGSTPGGSAAKDAGPSAEYAGRIKARIKPNIKLLTEVSGNPVAEVEVRCAPDGTIIARRIVKPSGNAVWDETVLRAIDATRLLPRDTDGRIPAMMILVFPRQE